MNYFIQASGYDLNMHGNIQYMNMHGFFKQFLQILNS
jgi:hypothetical protein